MGRKKWGNQFVDLRGRWKDNPGIVIKVIEDAKNGRDWTKRISNLLHKKASDICPRSGNYQFPSDLRFINLDEKDLSGARFSGANLRGATAYRCDGRAINCERSILDLTKWKNARLREGNFRYIKGFKADFRYADLRDAVFDGANLQFANFLGADLRGASFLGADLRCVHLTEADCSEAHFSKALLYGTSLWNIKYDNVTADEVDISRDGNGSVLTNNLPLANLMTFLGANPKLAEIISLIKLKTVVILGCDSNQDALTTLRSIADVGRSKGIVPTLVKEQKEIPNEPFLKKALMYCLLARYIVIENSVAAGQIVELDKVLSNGCVVAVLQEYGKGSTWLLEEKYLQYNTLKRFVYRKNTLQVIAGDAFDWCERATKEFGRQYNDLYQGLDLRYVGGTINKPVDKEIST